MFLGVKQPAHVDIILMWQLRGFAPRSLNGNMLQPTMRQQRANAVARRCKVKAGRGTMHAAVHDALYRPGTHRGERQSSSMK